SPSTCAASSSASCRGLATPAAASVAAASSTSGSTKQRFRVGLLQSRDDVVQVAVEHLIEVVRLEADPVVGDPVLREVVGPNPLAAVDRADLGAPCVGRLL